VLEVVGKRGDYTGLEERVIGECSGGGVGG
jgi:hypothetical protein